MSDLAYIKAKAKQYGSHFFDDEAMAFFNSRIEKVWRVKGKTYRMITSESEDFYFKRTYTVREVVIDEAAGTIDIDNVSGFQECATLEDAERFAKG